MKFDPRGSPSKHLAGAGDAEKFLDRAQRDKWDGHINDVVISVINYGSPGSAPALFRCKFRM